MNFTYHHTKAASHLIHRCTTSWSFQVLNFLLWMVHTIKSIQWNPVNKVTNGPKKFGHINGVAVLTKVFYQKMYGCFYQVANETVRHCFIECPLYSSPRNNLLSSAVRMFADRWSSMSKAQYYCIGFSVWINMTVSRPK